MRQLLGPTIGFFAGVSIILFRRIIVAYLEKTYEKFPKYDDGVRTFDIRFKVKSIYVVILGLIISMFSIIGFVNAL